MTEPGDGKSVALGNPYRTAVWQALGIHETGRDLHLGSLTLWRNAEAMQAISERYEQARNKARALSGFYSESQSSKTLLDYPTYLDVLRNLKQYTKAYLQGRYLHDDSLSLRALIENIDSKVHTPDASGYARYLTQNVDGLWSVVANDLPALMPAAERRRHTYIVGSTGSGKSQLLKAIVAEHFRLGDAMVLIDPHGTFALECAKLPAVAESDRLVYIRPGISGGHSPTLNPLEASKDATPDDKAKTADFLAEALDALTGGTGTARMTSFYRAIIRVLLDKPGSSLMDVYEMTTRGKLPEDIMKRGLASPKAITRSYFEEDIQSDDVRSAIAGVRARLRTVLEAEGIEEFLCGKSTIDLERMIDEGKIIIFDVGALGTKTGGDLGKIIMGLVAALGERRRIRADSKWRPVHVIVDECQHVLNNSIADILDGLRKFGVHLTLAQQRAGQDMPNRRVKEAVLYAPNVTMCGAVTVGDKSYEALGFHQEEELPAPIANERDGVFQFACRWGRGARPFLLNVRSDLVGQAVGETEWRDVMAEQMARYYRRIETEAEPGRDDDATATESPWELE